MQIKPYNAMPLGVQVTVPSIAVDPKYKDDVLHPCVRYYPEKFAGHDWWLTATPMPGNNDALENPILWYGDTKEDGTPPTEWTLAGLVEDTPSQGYNSDPCLYLENGRLWIIWRTANTLENKANNFVFAVCGKYTTDGITFSEKKLLCGDPANTANSDTTMCPIVVNFDGNVKMYSSDYLYKPVSLYGTFGTPKGLAIWDIQDNDLLNNQFIQRKTVAHDTFRDAIYWHFDVFMYDNKYYAIYTSVEANEIYLGVSDDGENFRYWSTPLISKEVTGRSRYYKPTAMVHNGIFYVWHPVVIVPSPVQSRLYMSQIPFDELIDNLEKGVSLII